MKAKDFIMNDFLKTNHLTVKNYSFENDVDNFIKEMKLGLKGNSSISMFPTFIEEERDIPLNKPILVLDAGGTNFRAAIVSFDKDKNPIISDFRKKPMPGTEREYTSNEFFDAITSFIEDIASKVDIIGFCFSYSMKKTQEKDGRLTHFSKEIKAPEVEGRLIGKGVMDSLKRKNIKNIKKIVLLNDTVATQLAGKAQDKINEFNSYIGIIIGTGVNACYNEKNCNILKEKNLPNSGGQIINTEVGSCKIIPYGAIDEEFRKNTAKPNAYHLEKMVSGGYIGKLWFFILLKASKAGCFSKKFSSSLEVFYSKENSYNLDASDLNNFIENKRLPLLLEENATTKDLESILTISNTIIKRAAYIASVMIVAIILKSEKSPSKERPIALCIDGSTFWKLKGLKEGIEKNLKNHLGKKDIFYRIIKINNAPIIGAAVAGLTN